MLDREYSYFKEHAKELAEQYDGKFIVIVGHEVVGVYGSNMEAYLESKKRFAPGTFLIQECHKDTAIETQTFLSRAHFPISPTA